MGEKRSWVGLDTPTDTVGLTGLVPFEILERPPLGLRPVSGMVRVWLDLAPNEALVLEHPLQYRVCGWEAGLLFASDGRIVQNELNELPLELPYERRSHPEPPAAGQLALDVAFRYRDSAGRPSIQDVQWRQPVFWNSEGTRVIELRFASKAFRTRSERDT